ncbi:Hypothetical protein MSYG_1815 [Malassezia sympodialis ATCC 42132]|uniref:Uncharacterized protein n=1 Tax=Malassezia sympodialis (strain ATCC 42132) TaxID=1230383 RepID=A0A1M8A4W7_MALS4|nr:Hypothetical protein MSYG_1815 [Malassezia sympodialis ATCC 42132]
MWLLRSARRAPVGTSRSFWGQRYAHSRHGKRDYIPAGQRPPSAWRDQRWSSRTMVTLSTSVGLTMYLIGLTQGFHRAQSQNRPEGQPDPHT